MTGTRGQQSRAGISPRIRLAQPNLPSALEGVGAVLGSGRLTQGAVVEELEIALAQRLGVPHVVAVSSGAAALYLSLRAREVGHGDAVAVPAYSFVASANVVEEAGASVRFVDVCERIPVMRPPWDALRDEGVCAVMPVHEFGLPAEIEGTSGHHRSRPTVVEDAACALGSTVGGQALGVQGDFGCFSLHPRKVVTSAEGGFIYARDPSDDETVRQLRSHGVTYTPRGLDVTRPSLNFRMSDVHAALGLASLSQLDRAVARRNDIAARYFSEIRAAGWILPEVPDGFTWNVQTFQIVLPEGVNRDQVVRHLNEYGIESGQAAQFIPSLTYYRKRYPDMDLEEFPNARRFAERGLALPAHEAMSDEDVDRILCAIDKLDV